MSNSAHPRAGKQADSRDISDLDRAAALRRKAVWKLTMSERLAQVHELSKQMNAVKGAAQTR